MIRKIEFLPKKCKIESLYVVKIDPQKKIREIEIIRKIEILKIEFRLYYFYPLHWITMIVAILYASL